jgi:hypothetical protein
MDYGALVSRAWQLTWRHKFLWILGLFATSTVGSCSGNAGSSFQWQTNGREVERAVPGAERAASDVGNWIVNNFGLITTVAVLAALIGVAVAVVSLIAQGAMAQATSEVARGRQTTLGQAWQVGLRLFWRYLGMWLVLLAVAIAVVVIIGILGGVLFAGALFNTDAGGAFLAFAGILAAIVFLIAIPVGIVVTIVVAYAQRAIAVEDVGPWEALSSGWQLLRSRPGPSLIVWLISLALSIAAAVVLGVIAVILLIPLGGIGLVLYFSTGISAGSIAFVVVALMVFVAAMWFIAGVLNAYFWNLWTLTYLHLTGRMEPAGPPAVQ